MRRAPVYEIKLPYKGSFITIPLTYEKYGSVGWRFKFEEKVLLELGGRKVKFRDHGFEILQENFLRYWEYWQRISKVDHEPPAVVGDSEFFHEGIAENYKLDKVEKWWYASRQPSDQRGKIIKPQWEYPRGNWAIGKQFYVFWAINRTMNTSKVKHLVKTANTASKFGI